MEVLCGVALEQTVTELKKGVEGLIKNYVEFEPVLEDIAFTLDAIESVLISKSEDQNAYLNLQIEGKVQEKLQKEIEKGQKLVKEYSEAGPSLWGCLKKATIYTNRLRKLDVSLRRQLEILTALEILDNRTGQLIYLMADKMNIIPEDRHPKYQNCQVLDQIQVEDASSPIQMDTPKEDVAKCQTLQVFAPDTKHVPLSGRDVSIFTIATIMDLLEKIITSRFRREAKGIKEPLKRHFTSHESRIKYIISMLDSLEPLIRKFAEISEGMNFPWEGVVQIVQEYIYNLCKARKWNIFKKHIYVNKLIGYELDILVVQAIRNVKYFVSMRKTSYVACGNETSSTSQVEEEVSVPLHLEIASPLKIPNLRSHFPPRLGQPQNKKKRVKSLAHKTRIFSSDEPALLPPGHNASTHSQHKPSPNSAIVPVDQEQYGKEESSHLYRAGMQDINLAMQRFHVMSTRLLQSEERIEVLETNYKNAEESWKLENRKLSELLNLEMAQVASLTKENDSLAEKIGLLEKNKVTASQEAQEILTTEWEPDFRRQMQEAEEEWFTRGCRVGFKSFLEKVEKKFPYLDLSDISQFEPIEFDMNVIVDLLGPDDYDNEADNDSDHGTNHSDEEDGSTDEERGGKTAAEVPGDALKSIYHYAVRDMIDGTTITVDMEKEILGVAEPIYILREDVMQFKEMTPISATCINVYMRHLYDVLKQSNTDGIFRFCDASSISVGTPEKKAQVLATRLQQLSTRQILLVPYNSGYHWTLTIINEEKNICYFMDPLHSETPVGWKSVVNNGIKKYNEKRGGGHQKIPQWKTLKGPKQPSNVECGYYVMTYMKEIVEDKGIFFAKKWGPKKSLSAYTERAVDEVCLEWASLVYRSLPKSGC
ncbi:hypothetical protein ACLB2K_003595 [Fragaria x ananassa]